MNVVGIIPARFESTRFPGKPLVEIHGISMIRRVYLQCLQSDRLDAVFVATDDERIYSEIVTHGGRCIRTSSKPVNGTERCHEAVQTLPDRYDVVVNIQGDEPFISPVQIDLLVGCFHSPDVQLATLIKKEKDHNLLHSPSTIKVVVNKRLEALYFSRSAIPHNREASAKQHYFKHIGIYGYRRDILDRIVQLPISPLEESESLEQLRWLENGFMVQTAITDLDSDSVDTPADLDKILAKYPA